MSNSVKATVTLLAIIALACPLHAADWAQQGGSNRDGVVAEPTQVSSASDTWTGAKLSWPGSESITAASSSESFCDQWPDRIYAGKMKFSAKEVASTPEGFTFRPDNDYGNVAFKATRISSVANKTKPGDGNATMLSLDARAFPLDKLPKMTGEKQRLSLGADISDVREGGAAFTAAFAFAGEDVTCKVERTEYKVTINPVPDIREMRYGPHFRQTIDFYKAKSAKPTPLLVSIHGGGWTGGNKTKMLPQVNALLSYGISVASISYRYVYDGTTDKVHPAVAAPLLDAARALQFLRSRAAELNIDKERVAAYGMSAGGYSAFWLAFHEDMADPASKDPVARESTRLHCVAGKVPPLSLDPQLWVDWDVSYAELDFFDAELPRKNIPELPASLAHSGDNWAISRWRELPTWLAHRDEWLGKGWIQEYSPYSHLTRAAPPAWLDYRWTKLTDEGPHSPQWGIHLKKRMDELGVECHLLYDGVTDSEYPDISTFLVNTLKEPVRPASRP